jgi:nucleoid DNA-binding protein
LTRDDLAKRLGRLGLTHDRARSAVDALFDAVSSALREGRSVSIVGFGKWEWRERRGRPVKDPRTGKTRILPPRKKLVFKPSDQVKRRLNGG